MGIHIHLQSFGTKAVIHLSIKDHDRLTYNWKHQLSRSTDLPAEVLDCCHSNHSRIHLSLCYGSFNSDCRPITINDCLFSSQQLVKSSYSKTDGQQHHNSCQQLRNGSEMLSPRNVWNVVPVGGSTVQMHLPTFLVMDRRETQYDCHARKNNRWT